MGKELRKGCPWFTGVGLADIAIGVEDTNVITVTIDLLDPNGKPFGQRMAIDAFLSTDAEGDNLTASAPTGGVAATTGHAIEMIADKMFKLVTNVDGRVVITLTESTAKTFYLVLCLPDNTLLVSDAITFA